MCFSFITKLFRREKIDHQVNNLQITEQTDEPYNPSEDFTRKEHKEPIEYIIVDEREAMAAVGLPTEFGSKKKRKNNRRKAPIGKEDFATFVLPSLKELYGIQTLESARPIVSKMGYFYENAVKRKSEMKANSQKEHTLEVLENTSEAQSTKAATSETDDEHNFAALRRQEMNIESQVDGFGEYNMQSNNKQIDGKVKNDIDVDVDSSINEGKDTTHSDDIKQDDSVEPGPDCSGSEYNSARSHCEDEIAEDDISNKLKKKSKKKKPTKNNSYPEEIENDRNLVKYWRRRYTLFSLYDRGIKMDAEAWFSATPECIAKHTANRLRCDIIVDAFCGTGGNSIQFAKTCNKVIAIDINPSKVEMAKHNADIYGVSDKIEFITGDYFQLAKTIRADAVFLSPPWGGPKYKCNVVYDLDTDLQPLPASSLFKLTREITNNIAIYLPKNSNTQQLIMLAGQGNSVELEKNYLFDRLTAITAYYGNLIQNKN
ncbi:trimethylguanosine synthase isoform X2 [Hermetia illucens]|uniref:trimethylguanosine synthase isoform X2 n=1 Tax=Hermetia illucens TaxID=343691 RepID=UPI0018CC792C|nr:trimethylguanosine synthase isoform X2 [Hermetia illucens]